MDISEVFPLYTTNSSGAREDIARITLDTINQTPSCLAKLATMSGKMTLQVEELTRSLLSCNDSDRDELAALFSKHGSDKSTYHNYYILYSYILGQRAEVRRVFEIGLGTNNTDVVSNMNANGKPGASLRAFRDYLPNAEIIGADIDKRILFTEDRIQTHYLDQTDQKTFDALDIGSDFDLMIDDGLHAVNTNINSLMFFIDKIKVGGWIVIEDIPYNVLPIWQVISCLLPKSYHARIFKTNLNLLFAVQRL